MRCHSRKILRYVTVKFWGWVQTFGHVIRDALHFALGEKTSQRKTDQRRSIKWLLSIFTGIKMTSAWLTSEHSLTRPYRSGPSKMRVRELKSEYIMIFIVTRSYVLSVSTRPDSAVFFHKFHDLFHCVPGNILCQWDKEEYHYPSMFYCFMHALSGFTSCWVLISSSCPDWH